MGCHLLRAEMINSERTLHKQELYFKCFTVSFRITGRLQSFFFMGFPGDSVIKNICHCRRYKRHRFNPWVGAVTILLEDLCDREPSRLQSMGLQRVGLSNWAHIIFLFHISQTPNEFVDSYFVHEEIKALTYSIFKDVRNGCKTKR